MVFDSWYTEHLFGAFLIKQFHSKRHHIVCAFLLLNVGACVDWLLTQWPGAKSFTDIYMVTDTINLYIHINIAVAPNMKPTARTSI